MIKFNTNNKTSIEVTQATPDGKINVDVLDSKGEVDYYYTITPADMVMLLNYYQHQKDRGKEIF